MKTDMVRMVENFTPEETKMVRDAYRNFLDNFNCESCPTILSTNPSVCPAPLLDFVIKKQGCEPCELCQGFPILLEEGEFGCPCYVLGKFVAQERLIKLVESWDDTQN